MLYWKPHRLLMGAGLLLLLSACGGAVEDGADTLQNDGQNAPNNSSTALSSSSASTSSDANNQGAPSEVPSTLLEGTITYDRVPFSGRSYSGLNYLAVQAKPARGVLVQVIDAQGQPLVEAITDEAGHYEVSVPADTEVQVRVMAELLNESQTHWHVQVRDNTNGDAQYGLLGSLASSGQGEQTRDLHAASGWDGNQYSATRSSAPFAILDSIFDALKALDNAQPGLVYPSLSVYWSKDNISISGDTKRGYIGTSYYSGSGPSIYVLGAQNNDSDEFDRAVIQHEFGHYVEDQLGRTESLGGSHSQNSRLDMRVAFGEAWGNAFAAMVSNDSYYRDSYGASQSMSFGFDVEQRGWGEQGWFSEATIQAILYDLFDDSNDGNDPINLGFAPIMQVLTSEEYLGFNGYASIYPFLDQLKQQQPQQATAIEALAQSYQVNGSGGFGDGETNNGGSAIVLPIYHSMNVGQTINLCSDSDYNNYNGMDIRRFVRIELPQTRNYQFSAVKTNGLFSSNPQIRISQAGRGVSWLGSGANNTETGERYLEAGQYILEIYEQANADSNDSNDGLVCFDLSVQ